MTHTFDRLLLDENPDAVIVTTPDTIVVHWNRGAEAIYGYTPDEAIGRRLPDLIVPEMTQSEITRLLEGAMRAGSLTAEGVRRRKDGTTIYIDVSCKVIRGGEGNVSDSVFRHSPRLRPRGENHLNAGEELAEAA